MTSKENVGLEIERKYIIEMPDFDILSKQENYRRSEIEQIYLDSPKGETHRIRRRVFSNYTEYTETRKIRIDKMSVTEIEGEISEQKYNLLKNDIKIETLPIIKIRHNFTYLGQVFEIDVYPQWKRSAVLETELADRKTVVSFPDFIRIIREVTGIKGYSNAAMSVSFPPEDKN